MVNSTSASLLGGESLSAIQSAFESAVAHGERPSAEDDYGIPQTFEDNFADDSELSKIPLLCDMTRDEILHSNGKLVRTICYVYHSDSEIYGGAYRYNGRWHMGRYGLDSGDQDGPQSDADIVFEERLSLQCRVIDIRSHDTDKSVDKLERSVNSMSINDCAAHSVVVKLYNEKEEGLLHSCLDVVGVLEVVESTFALHALITKNQRLASMITSSISPESESREVRAETLQRLEAALNGDSLAAELVLLALGSSVVKRSPVLLGPLCVNLRNADPIVAEKLSALISQLTANSFLFDMSIDNLNKSRLYASHDGEEFSPGALQLPVDTAVILNESVLSEGKLDERGVKNLKSLSDLITSQESVFHYPFSEFKIPMDLSFVVLSHGKSLLSSSVSIPLKKSSVWNMNSSCSLASMRAYLARCRLLEIEIAEEVSSEIQEDFVSLRKAGDPIDQAELVLNLALAKEITRSHGVRNMSWEDYVYAKALRQRIVSRGSF